jgi:hypothetical protein
MSDRAIGNHDYREQGAHHNLDASGVLGDNVDAWSLTLGGKMYPSLWRRLAAAFSLAMFVAGCASTQLNYNTLEISDTIDAILTKQVLANLGRFTSNPYAIPSMTTLSSGTITTTNSITPTLNDPLGNTVATTNSIAKIIGGTTTATGSVVGTSTGRGLTIAATDQWMQNWVTNPIIENHILRRLRALYRFAVNPRMTREQLICEYAIVTLSTPGKKYTIPCDARGNVMPGPGRSINPDPNFITRPGCVICEPLGGGHGSLVVNEKLRNGWLSSELFPAESSADQYFMGTYSGYSLSVSAVDVWAFYDFILFIQEATVEQAASASTNGGGGNTRQNPAKPTFVPSINGRPTQVEPPKNLR